MVCWNIVRPIGFQDFNSVDILKIPIFFCFCSNKYYIGCISNRSYWFVIRFYYSYIPVMLTVGGLLEYSHTNRISGFQQCRYFENSNFFCFCSNKYYIGCISNSSYWFVTRFNYSYIPIMLALCGLLWDLNYSLHGHICLVSKLGKKIWILNYGSRNS